MGTDTSPQANGASGWGETKEKKQGNTRPQTYKTAKKPNGIKGRPLTSVREGFRWAQLPPNIKEKRKTGAGHTVSVTS
jgi:hypothetical protein